MSTVPAPPVVSAEVLRFLFDFDQRALGLNTAGVTHAESLVPAHPGGNPMNWVLGHILANGLDHLGKRDILVVTAAGFGRGGK